MARTTLDIADPILKDLKRLQKSTRKSLGHLVSELLAKCLATESASARKPTKLRWSSRPMQAKVDLRDKEAVRRLLDQE